MNCQKIILKLIIVLITLNSCSKNDDEVTVIDAIPQYPMKSLIESGYMQVTYEKDQGTSHTVEGYINTKGARSIIKANLSYGGLKVY